MPRYSVFHVTGRNACPLRLLSVWLGALICMGCGSRPPAPDTVDTPPSTSASQPTVPTHATPAETPATLETVPTTQTFQQRDADLSVGLDAAAAGWTSESFTDAAASPLKKLAHLLASSSIDHQVLAEVTTSDFRAEPLLPRDLTTIRDDQYVSVRRWNSALHKATFDADVVASVSGLATTMAGLRDATVKLKLVEVELRDNGHVDTRIYGEGRGLRDGASRQWTAHWKCQWDWSSKSLEPPPKLRSIAVEDFEEVVSHDARATWFVDCSDAVFGNVPDYAAQFLVGMDAWVNRLEHRLHVNRLGHHGIAVGDVNGDGRDDIYVCHTGGLPNRLFVQTPDGTVQDQSQKAGVDFLDDSTCALLIDLDNDGDQDLVVATVSGGLALENDGSGRFQPRVHLTECRNAFSLTAADYNKDGRLDLYVGRYWPTEEARGEIPIPVPFFDARNGGRNTLYRNDGWKFKDVTREMGLDQDNTRYTMAAAWEDLDGDGDIDLYVANDFGRNCWYRNDGDRFSNQAAAAGLEDIATGMSVSFADYDHDGNTDVYVGNMFSTAGSRVAYQRQYSQQFGAADLSKVQRLARGNSLFQNQGDGTFHDVSEMARVTMGRWAWGSIFTDIDNDGWDDLIVANGHITTEDTGDL